MHSCRQKTPDPDLFAVDNLVAWCIVPYDAKQRNSEERAKMLHDLGITKLAYDWRDQHISTFDETLDAEAALRKEMDGLKMVLQEIGESELK